MDRMCMRVGMALALGVSILGCQPQPHTLQGSESVRIMTFNVQFLPSGIFPSSDDDVERPPRIVNRIFDAGYDFFVLNEVFDEDSRDVFVTLLRSTYPHYVAYIGDDAVGSEDSGLMLFSKWPFVPLSRNTHRADPGNIIARNGSNTPWTDVAFIEYEAHRFPDNWAAKGVAFVRIQNPKTERIYNVAFTHMQASYPEDEQAWLNDGPYTPEINAAAAHDEWWEPIAVRQSQMNDIRRIIEETMTDEQKRSEDVFVLGDLNIDGDLRDPNLGTNQCCEPNLYEWLYHFQTPGRYFTDTVLDAWVHEHSKWDPGLTNLYHWGPPFAPDMGARLDYFLRNRPAPKGRLQHRLAVQHLTLAHNMRADAPWIESGMGHAGIGKAGVNDLSDHIGINADINLWAPHCNPTAALTNPALNTYLPGKITFPGSMQWFRFDMPGTYSFAIGPDSSPVTQFRVYAPHDLSTPVPNYYEEVTEVPVGRRETIMARKYHVPEPPFFIRVFHTTRETTGDYTFVAHRHLGVSQEDAIVLRANDPVTHMLPNFPVNEFDTTWFELQLEMAASGNPQDLMFLVDQFVQDTLNLEIRAANGVTVINEAAGSEPDPNNPGGRRIVIQRDDLPTAAGKVYLLVKRGDPALPSYRIGWETNLTILHGAQAGVAGAATLNLFCVEETDTFGSDDIFLTIIADPDVLPGGFQYVGGTTVVNDVYLGEFVDGDYVSLENVIPEVRFLENIVVRLRESDGGLNFDDDIMTRIIPALPASETVRLNRQANLACCGGEYTFRYNLSRSLQK